MPCHNLHRRFHRKPTVRQHQFIWLHLPPRQPRPRERRSGQGRLQDSHKCLDAGADRRGREGAGDAGPRPSSDTTGEQTTAEGKVNARKGRSITTRRQGLWVMMAPGPGLRGFAHLAGRMVGVPQGMEA